MSDLIIQPVVPTSLALRPAIVTQPAIAEAFAGNASDAAGSGRENAQPPPNPTLLEQHLARRPANSRLTGPPPSFQANVLDVRAEFDPKSDNATLDIVVPTKDHHTGNTPETSTVSQPYAPVANAPSPVNPPDAS